jgi:hypothetical protein
MNDYPNLWKRGLIQAKVRDRANHCCEQCGMAFHPGTNLAVSEVNRLGKPIIGTVHHIDHNKPNCRMSNLVYLCQRCHWVLHLRDWKPGMFLLLTWGNEPPRWLIERGIDFKLHPQMRLFEVSENEMKGHK